MVLGGCGDRQSVDGLIVAMMPMAVEEVAVVNEGGGEREDEGGCKNMGC